MLLCGLVHLFIIAFHVCDHLHKYEMGVKFYHIDEVIFYLHFALLQQ